MNKLENNFIISNVKLFLVTKPTHEPRQSRGKIFCSFLSEVKKLFEEALKLFMNVPRNM